MQIVQKQTANFQRNQAIDLMNNWIVSGEEIDAVASNNDEMALGALVAMKQAGISPDKIKVGGIDGTADALAAMEAGDLAVTVYQDAKGQGKGAVSAAVKLARGEPVEKNVWIPFELVTRENYKQFMNPSDEASTAK
jgi:inositol transport system substrate-binding protein